MNGGPAIKAAEGELSQRIELIVVDSQYSTVFHTDGISAFHLELTLKIVWFQISIGGKKIQCDREGEQVKDNWSLAQNHLSLIELTFRNIDRSLSFKSHISTEFRGNVR